MRRLIVAIVTTAVAAITTAPASAFEVDAAPGVSATLDVRPDFTVCATVAVEDATAFVGELSAVGQLQGPGTRVGTVRGATPVAGSGTWSDCISGSYEGATVGDGKFSLAVHSDHGDFAIVKQCVVNRGALTCF